MRDAKRMSIQTCRKVGSFAAFERLSARSETNDGEAVFNEALPPPGTAALEGTKQKPCQCYGTAWKYY